jgi:hypothetical protein
MDNYKDTSLVQDGIYHDRKKFYYTGRCNILVLFSLFSLTLLLSYSDSHQCYKHFTIFMVEIYKC